MWCHQHFYLHLTFFSNFQPITAGLTEGRSDYFWLSCFIWLRKPSLMKQNILLVRSFSIIINAIFIYDEWNHFIHTIQDSQLRGPLPQLYQEGDSMKPMPKVMNNIYSLGPCQERVSWKSRNYLARILGSFLCHFSAALIKQDLDSNPANIFWASKMCQTLCYVLVQMYLFNPHKINKSNIIY